MVQTLATLKTGREDARMLFPRGGYAAQHLNKIEGGAFPLSIFSF